MHSLACSFVRTSRKFHLKNLLFRHVRLHQAIKKSDFLHACAVAHTHIPTMQSIFILPNLGKIIDLYKKQFGEYNKKNPALLTEDNIQLQLELIDGDLIIYAEFDST